MKFDIEKLRVRLQSEIRIEWRDCCDSTNTEAKRLALSGNARPTLVIADTQTAGRGRLGRSFYSPSGSGIYFSLLVPLAIPLSSVVTVTGAASVAVMRAVRELCSVQTKIKWVNDLLLDGKKVCGILSEAVTLGEQSFLIVGIGINLRPMAFPPELCEVAGTIGNAEVSREDLIAEVINRLLPWIADPADRSFLADYRTQSCVTGREIRILENGMTVKAFAKEIDEDCGLVVQTDAGERTLHTGEISIRFS